MPIVLTCAKPSKIPQNPQTWGDHIKKRRLGLGLFQRHIAEVIGVDECTVTNWEKNRTSPMLWLMPKIIEFLSYDPTTGEANTLGEKLLQYRKNRGVTQKDLAKQIGIDPTTLSRLERKQGRQNPSVLQKATRFVDTQS